MLEWWRAAMAAVLALAAMRRGRGPLGAGLRLAPFALAAAVGVSGCACGAGGPEAAAAGKVSVNGWEPVGLAGGGGMFAPAISPVDPDLMMVNCDMSGAYISNDGGRHWRMIHHLQLRASTRCRPGFHPKDANIIYATDGWEGRLKVSRDRGVHWEAIGDLPGGLVGEIAFDPEQPSLMLAGAQDKVWLSEDAGQHWRACEGPTGEAVGFFVDRTSNRSARVMLAATAQGIWRSQDGGRTWQSAVRGLPWVEIRSFAGGADPGSGRVMLYCAIPSREVDGQFRGGVYCSSDRGLTWQWAMGEGINKEIRAYDEWADGSIAEYWHVLTTNAAPQTVYAMNTSTGFHPPHHPTVYRSDDAGRHWRATLYFDPRFSQCNVAPDWFTVSTGRSEQAPAFGADICDSDPNRIIRVSGFCFITWDGGETWFPGNAKLAPGQEPKAGCGWENNGLVVTTAWHYYVDPHQPNRHYIAYTDIGLARSLDGGRSWIWWEQRKWPPWVNTCYELAFDPEVPGKIWGAFSNVHDIPNDNIISGRHRAQGPGGICLSTDFGESWQALGGGLPVAPATSIVVDPRSPRGRRTLYAAFFDDGVYRSDDDGMTWVKVSRGLGAPDNMRVTRLLLHQDGALFALITAKRQRDDYLAGGAGLWRSRDGGEGWECLTRSLDLRWPKDFAVHPRDSGIIFVGAANARRDQAGLYRTTDGGKNWRRVAREGPEHFGAAFDPRRPDTVYMTLTEGAPGPSLWVSRDLGETWEAIASFPFANTQRVEFDPENPGVIYVTTFGGSVFRGAAPQ